MSKELQKFIDSISYVGKSTLPHDDGLIYFSTVDHSYLTRVGMEDNLLFLMKNGITDEIQATSQIPGVAAIGFDPIKKEWYGWSHRALRGFGIGSECRMGDSSFIPSNEEEFIEDIKIFWKNEEYSMGDYEVEVKEGEREGKRCMGVELTYTYNNKTPNKAMRGTKFKYFTPFPEKWGRGQWKARTLEDAKQMAIDFASGVS